MNYPYRNQYYLQDLQAMKDRIDNQIREYQNNSIAPQPITQNFQITPQQNSSELESKYVENIDEVKNTFVMKTGIFINKDYSMLWIKDTSGNIRTFTLDEVIEVAYQVSVSGEVVLFSPASASFDMFKNAYQRGDLFKEKVNNL